MDLIVLVSKSIESLFNIVESSAVIIASLVAATSLDQWRKQLIGKRKMELAEDAIDIFSRLPGALNFVRSPLSFEKEGQSEAISDERITAGHIAFERLTKIEELLGQLRGIKYKFIAYFGNEMEGHFANVESAVHEISIAAHTLKFETPNSIGKERYKEMQRVVWKISPDDEFSKAVEAAKDAILESCLPLLTKN